MAGKQGDMGSRAVSAVAAMVASFAARKVLTFAWTKITGKEPPEHPEDAQVALSEALLWSLVTGIGVGTARLLVTRAAGKRMLARAEAEVAAAHEAQHSA
jgi:lysylphosphatidylglycerol synthetase-like protein (DUF2156 family)